MRVLVTDENRASRILLENIFKLKNFEVLDAKDSGEVLDLYKENQDTDVISASSTLPKGIDTVVNSFNGDDFDPIDDLIREHRLMERTVNTCQKIASKIHGDVDNKILAYPMTPALTIEKRLHRRKESHYMVNFLEKAISLEGEKPDDKLFYRASLKSVEEEHKKIDKVFKQLQYEILSQAKGKSNFKSFKNTIDDFAEILREHIYRQERFLFPLSRKFLDIELKKKLRVEFNKEENKIGKDKLKKLDDILSRVEVVLGIEILDQ